MGVGYKDILRSGKAEIAKIMDELAIRMEEDPSGGFCIGSSRFVMEAESFYKLKEFLSRNMELIYAVQALENVNGLFFVFSEGFGSGVAVKDFAWVCFYPGAIFPELSIDEMVPKTYATKDEVSSIMVDMYDKRGFHGMTRVDFDTMDASMDAFCDMYGRK